MESNDTLTIILSFLPKEDGWIIQAVNRNWHASTIYGFSVDSMLSSIERAKLAVAWGWSGCMCTHAILHGKLDILIWAERRFVCPYNAVYIAAKEGHLNILIWLRSRRYSWGNHLLITPNSAICEWAKLDGCDFYGGFNIMADGRRENYLHFYYHISPPRPVIKQSQQDPEPTRKRVAKKLKYPARYEITRPVNRPPLGRRNHLSRASSSANQRRNMR